ncbi:MAG: hypothetical protein R3C56_17635 [Pirellulaceae bacterium]
MSVRKATLANTIYSCDAFGEASGGKATVEIYTDYGTAEQAYYIKQVDLSDKDAIVQVTVQNGHRQEPLIEAELANVRKKQTELANSILGQMTTGSSSSSSSSSDAANYAAYRRMLAVAGRNAGPGFGFPSDAVPSAIALRSLRLSRSASMFPSAVIRTIAAMSASPNAIFQGIGEVYTFNSATGDTGTSAAGGRWIRREVLVGCQFRWRWIWRRVRWRRRCLLTRIFQTLPVAPLP